MRASSTGLEQRINLHIHEVEILLRDAWVKVLCSETTSYVEVHYMIATKAVVGVSSKLNLIAALSDSVSETRTSSLCSLHVSCIETFEVLFSVRMRSQVLSTDDHTAAKLSASCS